MGRLVYRLLFIPVPIFVSSGDTSTSDNLSYTEMLPVKDGQTPFCVKVKYSGFSQFDFQSYVL